jgi:hypothetical protein
MSYITVAPWRGVETRSRTHFLLGASESVRDQCISLLGCSHDLSG